MRKAFLFIFFGVFVSFLLNAQKATQENKWAVSLSGALIPLPVQDFGIQPGVAYKINNRLSVLTELTFRVGKKDNPDSEALDKRYFRIRSGLRYNLSGKRKILNPYIGLQCSYAFRKFTDVKYGFYYDDLPGDSVYFYDKAEINSPVATLSFQWGALLYLGEKFSLDLFTGAGLRFINTTYSNVENPVKGFREIPRDEIFITAYKYSGSVVRPHLEAGVRLIYHFHHMGNKQ
jgi:hypothetical protein